MAVINRKQKKDLAKQLYLKSQMSQKEIAEMVGVTEKTISTWINDDTERWGMLKSSLIITKESELRRIYIQINELNTTIERRDEGKRYASPSESDTLSKLAATSKALESDASISEIVNVFIEFSEFLKQTDLQKSKDFIVLQDAFVKHKLSKA
jgi:DNA-binding XRE family transcriptional regulator